MKNFTRIAGTQSRRLCAIALAAVIGFSFAACGGSSPSDDEGPGKTLTITGLEDYNGQWADVGFGKFTENEVEIYLQTVEEKQLISGGTVTFNIEVLMSGGVIQTDDPPYKGSYNSVPFSLAVVENEDDDVGMLDVIANDTANFSAGNATYEFVVD